MDDLRSRIEDLIKENDRLINENESLKRMLGAKRYRIAEKLANSYNALLPVGTKRRRMIIKSTSLLKKISDRRTSRIVESIKGRSGNYKKVIVISGTAWGTPLPQRSHQLAKEFAKHNDILVIYYELDDSYKRFKVIQDNLILLNDKSVLLSIRIGKDQRGFFVLNNVGNVKLSDVKVLKNNGFGLIYECIDELDESLSGGMTINQKQILERLPDLDIDLFVSTAKRLTKQLKKIVPDANILISRNAVNVEEFEYIRFSKNSIPFDLKSICDSKKAIVGYYGAISPWLDYDLIHDFAKKHPDIGVVLIGVDYGDSLKRLDNKINNVYYLGAKKQKELPIYAVHFDCGIIPFLPGKIAMSTSPIKLFEYMALGLPTVCTKDLNECRGFEYVYVAKNEVEFENDILRAITESGSDVVKKKLLEQASQNTWFIRAEDILKEIQFS